MFASRSLGASWEAIPAAELALKAPSIESSADAELLLREVRVYDEYREQFIGHFLNHLRIKVFTERGKELQSTVRIPYRHRTDIEDIEARTVLPDGRSIAVEKSAIFRREVVRTKGVKEFEVSFAFPAVEPGAILEYRYHEIRHDQPSHYLRLYFSNELPTHRCIFHVKPFLMPEWDMHFRVFGAGVTGLTRELDGNYRAEGLRLRGWSPEPFMPGESLTQAWILVYYQRVGEADPERYWRNLSREVFDQTQAMTRPGPELREAANRAIGTATDPIEKLRRLHLYSQKHVRTASPGKDRSVPHENARADAILEAGLGSPWQVNRVFMGLARAAGFDAREALLADRMMPRAELDFLSTYLMPSRAVAIRMTGGTWEFFDPAERHLAPRMLSPSNEGVRALISDSDLALWTTTPVTVPSESRSERIGNFRLDGEGVLEGDVRIQSVGHEAAQFRKRYTDLSAAERESDIRERLTRRFSDAELTGVAVEALESPEQPLVLRYRLRVPGYATVSDRRVVLQPQVFRLGLVAPLTSTQRRFPIEFPYAWTEIDSVHIQLPEGVRLEAAAAPEPARARDVARYQTWLNPATDGRALEVQRLAVFGENGALWFPVTSYAGVRDFFSVMSERDQFSVTLARGEPQR